MVGFGNPNAVLFSYGGITPGPTIRMKGDEILFAKLRNMLGEDQGKTPVGHSPDPNELTPELDKKVEKAKAAGGSVYDVIPADLREDFCLGEHTNGVHSAHVTNLHTHGLHVRPGRNPDGTHSDNVILRILSQADLKRREKLAKTPACEFLRDPEQTDFLRGDEQAGEGNYEFHLGDVMGNPNQPHPPGTHWYHPHSHGATHNQVASGMAGYLIIEGDVDAAINKEMTGSETIDPEFKTGPYDYRERLVFMQLVLVGPKDPDSDNPLLSSPPTPTVNGNSQPKTITMSPGAVERWRVLNGSVDGRGFKRFMVLKGQYVYQPDNDPENPACKPKEGQEGTKRLFKVVPDPADPTKGRLERVSRHQIDEAKQHLYQLSMDGVTLVSVENGRARYTIKDLARQNTTTQNPLANPAKLADNPNKDALLKYQNVFKNGRSIRDCWVRPNEVYLGPANRADLFFKAPSIPKNSEGEIYTIFAQAVVVHADNYQQNLQKDVQQNNECLAGGPEDIVLAYIVVKGDPVKGGSFDVMSLRDVLPPAPPYLRPIADRELQVTREESRLRNVKRSQFRTRTVTYSGWGAQDFPLIKVPDSFVRDNPDLKDLIYAPTGPDKVNVLLPAAIRTMAIDGRKFDPTDPKRPRMLLDTAEEWALYNSSTMLWGDTDKSKQPSYQFKGHYVSLPISRAKGQADFEKNEQFQIVTKGVDHPFHIHQNPFWVTRIEIPDENGELHNILDEPRWQDVIWIPRHRGRVVFRSRFPDFVGTYVNHCHLLLHEDNGMMTVVEVTPFEDQTNFVAKNKVASPKATARQVSNIYPRPSPEEAYTQSIAFDDPNASTGQQYPGFPVEPPGGY